MATYSVSFPSPNACRNANTPTKFDFPDPFAPIKMLIGRSGRFSIAAMLLKPRIVIVSIGANPLGIVSIIQDTKRGPAFASPLSFPRISTQK